MSIDVNRVVAKALETALEEDHEERRRGSTVRAMAAGAALATAARFAVKARGLPHLPARLPNLAALRDIPDRLRVRMAAAGLVNEPEVEDDFDEEDEEPEEEGDEEPEAEAEDEYEDEDDYDDEEEDEDEDLEDEE